MGDANLRGALLSLADLRLADLIRADLSYTNLSSAHLSFIDRFITQTPTHMLDEQGEGTKKRLAQAKSLVGATLPDGTKMTEEAWEEFKKRYRQ